MSEPRLKFESEHFVTLFDSFFLPQGLALHRSLMRHCEKFILWILCIDSEVYDVLVKVNLSNVKLLKLSDYEDKELLAIKKPDLLASIVGH